MNYLPSIFGNTDNDQEGGHTPSSPSGSSGSRPSFINANDMPEFDDYLTEAAGGGDHARDQSPSSHARKLGGLRGSFNRKLADLKKSIPLLRNSPSKTRFEAIKKDLLKVEQAADKYERSVEIVLTGTDDHKRQQDLEAQLSIVQNDFHAVQEDAIQAIGLHEARFNPQREEPNDGARGNALANNGGGGDGQAAAQRRRGRVQDSLRPFLLTNEHNLTEFRHWAKELKAFFIASDLATAPNEERHAHFFKCVDSKLLTRIESQIANDAAVYTEDNDPNAANSCLGLLRADIRKRYPLFNRRHALFQSKQAAGEKWLDMDARIRQAVDEAEVEALNADDLLVQLLITATSDKVLRAKFLELNNPTSANVRDVATAYETAALGNAGLADDTIAGIRNGGGGNGGGGKRKWNKKNECIDGKCKRCGAENWDAKHIEKCPAYGTTCSTCKKRGHFAKVCLSSNNGGGGKPQHRHAEITGDDGGAPHADFINVLAYAESGSPTPKLRLTVKPIGGNIHTLLATPDTGCTKSTISQAIVDELNIPMHAATAALKAANGAPLKVSGAAQLLILDGRKVIHRLDMLVSPDVSGLYLSWKDLIVLKVIPDDFPRQGATDSINAIGNDDCSKLRDQLIEKFTSVFGDEIKESPMRTQPMKIHMRDDIKIVPRKVLTARQVPIHWRDDGKAIVDDAVAKGIAEWVSHPTDWISPAFFVPKAGGKGIRLVTDFTNLNQYVKRPVHPFPSAREIVMDIEPEATVFATLDAVQGYHQIELDEDSRDLTTFLLPWGKLRYKRCPMGLSASSDVFCEESDKVIRGIKGTRKIVDDILVAGKDLKQLEERVIAVLERCSDAGITISLKKFKVSHTVGFAGYIVSPGQIRPDPKRAEGIAAFPAPKDTTGLRGFLGLAQQLANFVPDLAHVTAPLHKLLCKDVAWVWLDEHQAAFEQTKSILTGDLVLKSFSPDAASTELLTDASRLHGIGYALIQTNNEGKRNLVHCGSRSLNGAESRYATIEIECLAIQYGVDKCRHFLAGMSHFDVITDHRPLVGTFKKPLEDIPNARLQRMRERLAQYHFSVNWAPGKTHYIADALSRAPVFDPPEEEDVEMVNLIVANGSSQLAKAAAECSFYSQIMAALSEGKDCANLPPSHPARQFKGMWNNLSVDSGLLVYNGTRIVIPAKARAEVLEALHKSHVGSVKMLATARPLYYWPGMANDIRQKADGCAACVEVKPKQQKEPLTPATPYADLFPMAEMGADLFELNGRHFLVLVDRYSGYPFTWELGSLKTDTIIKALQSTFYDFGRCGRIRTDGGPQFRSQFSAFCQELGIVHEKSSPYNPQSNGLSEAAVKQTKALLRKSCDNWPEFKARLAEWRNAARADGFSPAQMFFGRRMRTGLPVTEAALRERADLEAAEKARQKVYDDNRSQFDSGAQNLVTLKAGVKVWIQNPVSSKWDSTGVIRKAHGQGSFVIDMDSSPGLQMIRNRKFLRIFAAETSKPEPPAEAEHSGPPPPPQLRRSSRIQARALEEQGAQVLNSLTTFHPRADMPIPFWAGLAAAGGGAVVGAGAGAGIAAATLGGDDNTGAKVVTERHGGFDLIDLSGDASGTPLGVNWEHVVGIVALVLVVAGVCSGCGCSVFHCRHKGKVKQAKDEAKLDAQLAVDRGLAAARHKVHALSKDVAHWRAEAESKAASRASSCASSLTGVTIVPKHPVDILPTISASVETLHGAASPPFTTAQSTPKPSRPHSHSFSESDDASVHRASQGIFIA